MTNKALSEEEMEELRELIGRKQRIALVVAVISAISALISALGTSIAGIIVAMKAD